MNRGYPMDCNAAHIEVLLSLSETREGHPVAKAVLPLKGSFCPAEKIFVPRAGRQMFVGSLVR